MGEPATWARQPVAMQKLSAEAPSAPPWVSGETELVSPTWDPPVGLYAWGPEGIIIPGGEDGIGRLRPGILSLLHCSPTV